MVASQSIIPSSFPCSCAYMPMVLPAINDEAEDQRRAKKRISDATYRATHLEECLSYEAARYAKNGEARRASNRAYYAAHAEKYILRNAAYYATHREQIRASTIARRAAHVEKARVQRAAYYAADPEKVCAQVAQWRKANPDKIRANHQRRRALKAEAPLVDFTAAQWLEMKAAYGNRCAYCDRKMARLTQDHITPLSKGGSHTASNIVPACQSCNSKKGTRAVLKPVQPLLLTVAKCRSHRHQGDVPC